MSEALAEVEWIRGLFDELTNPKFSIVEWAARSRNRGLLIAARSSDAEARFPKVLSIGDAKSFYDHLRTETAGGANDRRTAIDIQIIRANMDAQDAMVRWVDHRGMYADAMTKKNGNVPLLHMLFRTGRICITEESITLEKHKSNPSSRNRSSKTHIDQYLLMGVRVSVWNLKTRWCVNSRHVNRSQNQKKFMSDVNNCAHTLVVLVLCIFGTCRAFLLAEVFLSRCPFVKFSCAPVFVCLKGP